MVAIIDTNSQEIISRPNWSYKGLYPLGAVLSHSCIINSRHILEKDSPYYNICRSTSFIPKGKGPSLITLARFCLFVCFKGGMGTWACHGSPLCLMNLLVFAEIPNIMNSLCIIRVVQELGRYDKRLTPGVGKVFDKYLGLQFHPTNLSYYFADHVTTPICFNVIEVWSFTNTM